MKTNLILNLKLCEFTILSEINANSMTSEYHRLRCIYDNSHDHFKDVTDVKVAKWCFLASLIKEHFHSSRTPDPPDRIATVRAIHDDDKWVSVKRYSTRVNIMIRCLSDIT